MSQSSRSHALRDYSPSELEALDVLGKQTFMDGWVGFPVCPIDDLDWAISPENTAKIDEYNRRNARLARACRLLEKRGIVERRRCPIDGRSVDYRLIESLRASPVDDELRPT